MVRFCLDFKIILFDTGFYYIHDDDIAPAAEPAMEAPAKETKALSTSERLKMAASAAKKSASAVKSFFGLGTKPQQGGVNELEVPIPEPGIKVTEYPKDKEVEIEGKKYFYDGKSLRENGEEVDRYKEASYTTPYQYFTFDDGKLSKYADKDKDGNDIWNEIALDNNIINIYYDKYYFKDGLLYFYNYFKIVDKAEDTAEFRPSISKLGRYDIIRPLKNFISPYPDIIKPKKVLRAKRRQTLLAQNQLYGNCFAHSVARSMSKLIKSYSTEHNFGPLIDNQPTVIVGECDQKHIESENPDTYTSILSNTNCKNNSSRNYALLYSYILNLIEYYFGTDGGPPEYILEFFSKYFNYIVNCKRKKDILTPNLDAESVKMLNDFTTELVKNGDRFSFKYADIENNDKSDYNWIINPENKGDFNDILSIKQLIKSNKNYCSFSVTMNNIQGIRFYLIALLQKRNIPINDNDENIIDENKLRDVAEYYRINNKDGSDYSLSHALIITDWDDEKGITILNTWGYDWGIRGKIVIKDHKLLGEKVDFAYLFISKEESKKRAGPCSILKNLLNQRDKINKAENALQFEKLTNGIGLLVDTEFGIYNEIKKDFSKGCKSELENAQQELGVKLVASSEPVANLDVTTSVVTPGANPDVTTSLVTPGANLDANPVVTPVANPDVTTSVVAPGANLDANPVVTPGANASRFPFRIPNPFARKNPVAPPAQTELGGGKKRTIKQKYILRKTRRKSLRRSKIKPHRSRRFLKGKEKIKKGRRSRK
jgi:hypothetical protein